ncbi:GCD complex subunit gcd7 [Orbilia brochopaga]|uniref:Translation initiation factor eIF2B subunit beta n=1 Tax=Orbilia brochopaga TaxID=3140254 RepID=A0AAV9VC28_9PEZI
MMRAEETPPELAKFLKVANTVKANECTEILTGLLKRRQIKASRNVAQAIAKLLLRYVSQNKHTKLSEANSLIKDVRDLGRQLVLAQPKEMVIGNIVRRVIGVIREEANTDDNNSSHGLNDLLLGGRSSRASSVGEDSFGSGPNSGTATPLSGRPFSRDGEEDIDDLARRKSKIYIPNINRNLTRVGSFTAVNPSFSQTNLQHAMFSLLLSSPLPAESPMAQTPTLRPESREIFEDRDIRGDVIDGIKEIMEELTEVDNQLASHSEIHIHSDEFILVFGASLTVHKFLMRAAVKRRFTVMIVESHPNDHHATHEMLRAPSVPRKKKSSYNPKSNKAGGANQDEPMTIAEFKTTLTSMGVEVMLLPDSLVPAAMSRVNKVIMGCHVIFRNGSCITSAGAKTLARCAQEHATPVVVVSGVYKVSPIYPFNPESMLEIGDSSNLVSWAEGDMVANTEIANLATDFVPDHLIDHYITNVGGYTPQNLYKLVEEQYGSTMDSLE